MTRQGAKWFGVALLALGLGTSAARAQTPLKWAQNLPGNSKAIVLYADDITSWTEKGNRVFLLRGRVWIEQGVVQMQMPQGTVWVDLGLKQRSGIYHVEIYPDGEVTLNDGPNRYAGAKGHIELNSRGEVHLKSYRGKIAQTATPADPMFLRAVAMKYNLADEAAKVAVAPASGRPIVATGKAPALPVVAPPQTSNVQLSGYLPPPPTTRPVATGQPVTLPALTPQTNSTPAVPQVQLGFPQ